MVPSLVAAVLVLPVFVFATAPVNLDFSNSSDTLTNGTGWEKFESPVPYCFFSLGDTCVTSDTATISISGGEANIDSGISGYCGEAGIKQRLTVPQGALTLKFDAEAYSFCDGDRTIVSQGVIAGLTTPGGLTAIDPVTGEPVSFTLNPFVSSRTQGEINRHLANTLVRDQTTGCGIGGTRTEEIIADFSDLEYLDITLRMCGYSPVTNLAQLQQIVGMASEALNVDSPITREWALANGYSASVVDAVLPLPPPPAAAAQVPVTQEEARAIINEMNQLLPEGDRITDIEALVTAVQGMTAAQIIAHIRAAYPQLSQAQVEEIVEEAAPGAVGTPSEPGYTGLVVNPITAETFAITVQQFQAEAERRAQQPVINRVTGLPYVAPTTGINRVTGQPYVAPTTGSGTINRVTGQPYVAPAPSRSRMSFWCPGIRLGGVWVQEFTATSTATTTPAYGPGVCQEQTWPRQTYEVNMAGLSGRTLDLEILIKNTSARFCNLPDHRMWLKADNFVFTAAPVAEITTLELIRDRSNRITAKVTDINGDLNPRRVYIAIFANGVWQVGAEVEGAGAEAGAIMSCGGTASELTCGFDVTPNYTWGAGAVIYVMALDNAGNRSDWAWAGPFITEATLTPTPTPSPGAEAPPVVTVTFSGDLTLGQQSSITATVTDANGNADPNEVYTKIYSNGWQVFNEKMTCSGTGSSLNCSYPVTPGSGWGMSAYIQASAYDTLDNWSGWGDLTTVNVLLGI